MTKEPSKMKYIAKPCIKLDDLPAKIEVSSEISWRDVNGETIILNLKTGEYFTLNDTGKILWKGICENQKPSELVLSLANEYKMDNKEVERDVLDFISGLLQKEVLIMEV
jgi:hypothetical protein